MELKSLMPAIWERNKPAYPEPGLATMWFKIRKLEEIQKRLDEILKKVSQRYGI